MSPEAILQVNNGATLRFWAVPTWIARNSAAGGSWLPTPLPARRRTHARSSTPEADQ